MIKAAFFDIDGTLLSFKTHRIPASAQQVLDSFHEQGIACVIATGRPTYQNGRADFPQTPRHACLRPSQILIFPLRLCPCRQGRF